MNKDQKIIVLDGPDNTFKTPLARVLSEQTGIPVFKNRKEKDIFKEKEGYLYDFRYSQSYITQFLEQTNYSIIFDRSWPSQYVYSLLTNRTWDYNEWLAIDQKYSSLNAYVVIPCRTDYSKSIDDLFTTHEIQRQHELYEDFVAKSKCQNIMLLNVDCIEAESDLQRKAEDIRKFVGI